jgi:hypothetical protein
MISLNIILKFLSIKIINDIININISIDYHLQKSISNVQKENNLNLIPFSLINL